MKKKLKVKKIQKELDKFKIGNMYNRVAVFDNAFSNYKPAAYTELMRKLKNKSPQYIAALQKGFNPDLPAIKVAAKVEKLLSNTFQYDIKKNALQDVIRDLSPSSKKARASYQSRLNKLLENLYLGEQKYQEKVITREEYENLVDLNKELLKSYEKELTEVKNDDNYMTSITNEFIDDFILSYYNHYLIRMVDTDLATEDEIKAIIGNEDLNFTRFCDLTVWAQDAVMDLVGDNLVKTGAFTRGDAKLLKDSVHKYNEEVGPFARLPFGAKFTQNIVNLSFLNKKKGR